MAKDPETGKSCYEVLQEMANEVGYVCEASVVDAQEYGAPHSRPRAYIYAVWVGRDEAIQ